MTIRGILLLGAFASQIAIGQSSMVIQRTPLAGFNYHNAPTLWSDLQEGDALALIAEPDNPHDPQAVRVDWQGQTLGYLPRTLNGAVSRSLAEGTRLSGKIKQLRSHPDPRRRIEIEILFTLHTTIEK